MAKTDLTQLELTDVARRLAKKEVSPVELTKAVLRRIEKTDKKLSSYALVTADLALKQAKKAEAELAKGRVKGPLHGVPIAVKDLCCTKGIVTAAGTKVHGKFKPKLDSTVVARFAAAGAVLLGKLQMTEGAFAEHHPDVKVPKNPWGADYWCGASSSGSGVATAAGLCFGSIGSDTGGSIRFPSAANGVTGLKPTWGRVSRFGVFDLAPSLDHVGPMARSAADCAALLGAIAGADKNDPTAAQVPVPNYLAGLERGIRGLKIGIDDRYNAKGVDTATVAMTKRAAHMLSEIGAELVDVRFPDVDRVVREWLPHCAVETAFAHKDTYPKRKGDYGPALAGLIDAGREVSGLDYQGILLNRAEFSGRVQAVFEDCDLILMPAMPYAAPTLEMMATLGEDPDAINTLLRFTAPIDYSGNPALTMPGGMTETGVPIGFQLVGRHFEEDTVLRAGAAFQRATDWHKARPKL
ncbi:MAG: amidase [Alphaproteobacteria bacterium]